jgi:hypothetical protein
MRSGNRFRLFPTGAEELPARSLDGERSLQAVIARHTGTLLGLRLVASTHPTGRSHGGRSDTLGLDESGRSVTVETERAISENAITQGLYDLDWLLDHRAEFRLLAFDRPETATADGIAPDAPRLICAASDFTRCDVHAIKRGARSIDLVRYRHYGGDFVLLKRAATSHPLLNRSHPATHLSESGLPRRRSNMSGPSPPRTPPAATPTAASP